MLEWRGYARLVKVVNAGTRFSLIQRSRQVLTIPLSKRSLGLAFFLHLNFGLARRVELRATIVGMLHAWTSILIPFLTILTKTSLQIRNPSVDVFAFLHCNHPARLNSS